MHIDLFLRVCFKSYVIFVLMVLIYYFFEVF